MRVGRRQQKKKDGGGEGRKEEGMGWRRDKGKER